MRTFALALTCLALASAAPRVDNVLMKMVPPGATALAGVHLDQLRQTEMYRRLPLQILAEMDRFPQVANGFDPRRDVREILFASTPKGGILLARGTFPAKRTQWGDMDPKRHGQYTVWARGHSAFCILDATLAVAGEPASVEAALDEWTSGAHTAAAPLLARAGLVGPQSQAWGISADLAASLAGRVLAGAGNGGFVFANSLAGLGECWFEANLSTGIHLEIHGVTGKEAEAVTLRDAFRGMVGLGRLNVPDDKPELLRVWDGIAVEQTGRAVVLRADIPQSLADKLLDSVGQAAAGRRQGVL